jgi:peptidyl-tRNA hydrolase, PTH1 family
VRVIVGLGNPGAEYEGTRHNVGFLVVAGLAEEFRVRLSAGRGDFISGYGRVAGQEAVLAMPLTYMNRSGLAVARLLDETDAPPSDLLVICDDVNLPLGQLRLRSSGSDGGHNGLASIISYLGTEAFPRLRLGVGMPAPERDMADYVLDRFLKDEEDTVSDMVARAKDAIRDVLREGIDRAMALHNRRLSPSAEDEA